MTRLDGEPQTWEECGGKGGHHHVGEIFACVIV